MSDYEKEKMLNRMPIPVPLEGLKKIIYQMENCLCKIFQENGGKGTGFFCNIPYYGKTIPFLLTNNHVLNKNDIEDNKIIRLTINDKPKKIKIDKTRKKYTNEELDITFIEIKPDKDDINIFMELDNDINKNNTTLELEYMKKSIYIIQYLKGELNVSYGLIDNLIEGKKINHCCNTEEGSSGSPILSLKTYKIIGIHYGGNNNKNFGTFIKYAIEQFEKEKQIKYKNEINLKYKIEEYEEDAKYNIFGKKFVEKNYNKIDLIINGEESK